MADSAWAKPQTLLANELQARYFPGDPLPENPIAARQDFMRRFVADLGLEPYDVLVSISGPPQRLGQEQEKVGHYRPSEARIWLADLPATDRDFLAAPAHELAHLADHLVGYTPLTDSLGREIDPSVHFAYYDDFDVDFANQLRAQREYEQTGVPYNPDDLEQFPWLSSVVPLSSNRLASPWRKEEMMPAFVYNARRAWHPPMERPERLWD